MELGRVGQVLLPFLAPSAHLVRGSRTAATTTIKETVSRQWRCQNPSRSFTTSGRARQEDRSSDPLGASEGRSQSNRDSISSLLDSTLDFTKGTATTSASRTSRFSSRSAQQGNRPPDSDSAPPTSGSDSNAAPSMDDYRPAPTSQRQTLDELLMTIGKSPAKTQRSAFASARENYQPAPLVIPVTKLNPSLGRTVHITPETNMDAARAFSVLNRKCKSNKIRQEYMLQRFHERPGLKRKRLKSERWRKRFRNTFHETVQMVQKMRRQGW